MREAVLRRWNEKWWRHFEIVNWGKLNEKYYEIMVKIKTNSINSDFSKEVDNQNFVCQFKKIHKIMILLLKFYRLYKQKNRSYLHIRVIKAKTKVCSKEN